MRWPKLAASKPPRLVTFCNKSTFGRIATSHQAPVNKRFSGVVGRRAACLLSLLGYLAPARSRDPARQTQGWRPLGSRGGKAAALREAGQAQKGKNLANRVLIPLEGRRAKAGANTSPSASTGN